MNADEVWRQLGSDGEFPREALQWALDHWDEVSPRFIAKLRAYANSRRADEADREALFYVVHLCAEKRDSRAYTAICELVAGDADIQDWLGDMVTETLRGVLINVCDGDVEPLKRAIESTAGDEFARGSALNALAYLVRARNVLTDDEMREYLMHLRADMQPRGEATIWDVWAFAIAKLGYETLRAEVARVYSLGWIDPGFSSLEDFYAELQLSRRDADGLAAFREDFIAPFESTIETFDPANGGRGDAPYEAAFDDDGGYIQTPYVNPLRDVGRNDPCPCGSGKKYKKCCLAA